jgi:hypothetical protein
MSNATLRTRSNARRISSWYCAYRIGNPGIRIVNSYPFGSCSTNVNRVPSIGMSWHTLAFVPCCMYCVCCVYTPTIFGWGTHEEEKDELLLLCGVFC